MATKGDKSPENTAARNQNAESSVGFQLRLYVAGQTPRSLEAFTNLRKICEEFLKGSSYAIEVIDLLENPELAKCDEIVAIPTLVRKHPEPVRKIVGTLADTEQVLAGLDLHPRPI